MPAGCLEFPQQIGLSVDCDGFRCVVGTGLFRAKWSANINMSREISIGLCG